VQRVWGIDERSRLAAPRTRGRKRRGREESDSPFVGPATKSHARFSVSHLRIATYRAHGRRREQERNRARAVGLGVRAREHAKPNAGLARAQSPRRRASVAPGYKLWGLHSGRPERGLLYGIASAARAP
jgi:hypothetical protein